MLDILIERTREISDTLRGNRAHRSSKKTMRKVIRMNDQPTSSVSPRQLRKVLLSAYLGSTVEFYDFLLYGTAASLVFGHVFFSQLDPAVGTIASFGTLAAGFIARPLGGIVFGHFGDRVGRKSVLVTTMTLMGLATTLIGLLPTYDQIGIWAPLLLVFLRVVQGIAVGGEWGGATLMSLEHTATDKRGFAASFSNMGAPSGGVAGDVGAHGVLHPSGRAVPRLGLADPLPPERRAGRRGIVGAAVGVGVAGVPGCDGAGGAGTHGVAAAAGGVAALPEERPAGRVRHARPVGDGVVAGHVRVGVRGVGGRSRPHHRAHRLVGGVVAADLRRRFLRTPVRPARPPAGHDLRGRRGRAAGLPDLLAIGEGSLLLLVLGFW